MIETYNKYFEMIKEYVYREEDNKSDRPFDSSVEALKEQVVERIEAVVAYF